MEEKTRGSNSGASMRGGNERSDFFFLSSCLTLQHLVVDPLFTGDDQVKSVLAVLKALGLGFNSLIAVQHVQDAILCVSEGVKVKEHIGRDFRK